ncbi:N-formylglutamate amidohydrolase [Hellea balneolensis]|uniref:N-formylglutamate amidohydrolase n=1 Tax=Hellea balneolensis TaxID=287478 RepID=UPI0004291CD6|nr:N-formylglutamate amidohydrolase [Hellea balneolensis]
MLARETAFESDCLKAFTPPIRVIPPKKWRRGVIFASPHSGNVYPKGFTARSSLSLQSLRRNEDAYIAELFAPAVICGAPLLAAQFPRCFVDVNRAPNELPLDWAPEAGTPTPRAAAGLGVIPTMLSESLAIYKKPLSYRAARARLTALYHPYHDALQDLITQAGLRFGSALLIDCHSMPGFAPMGSRRPDIILGDRFGVSCYPETITRVELAFRRQGYNVTRNYPYAGGYVTQHYGKPRAGIEALQIEINRDLYLNPVTLKKKRSYAALAENLKTVISDIIEGQPMADLLAAE